MNAIQYRIRLDVSKADNQSEIVVKQNDTRSRVVRAYLSNGSKPYEIAEGVSAVVRGKKPSGAILYNACEIDNDFVVFEITNQMIAEPGVVECEITLNGADGEVLTSPSFLLFVEGKIFSDDEVESTNEFTALQRVQADLNKVLDSWDSATASASTGDHSEVVVTIGEDSVHFDFILERGTKGITILAHYDTLEELRAEVPFPEIGDTYSIGTELPYDIYTYDAVLQDWKNNGNFKGAPGEDGISITDARLSDDGDLLIDFSNNQTKNVGFVKGTLSSDTIPTDKKPDILLLTNAKPVSPFITAFATLTVAGWSAQDDGNFPFTQMIEIPGLPAGADGGEVQLADAPTKEQYEAAASCGVQKIKQKEGVIVCGAYEQPEIDLPIQVRWWQGMVAYAAE